MTQWEPLTDFEDDYEVETEPPHRIRRKRDGFMPKLTLNKTLGYLIVTLNGVKYYYHRILAKHFIPNPDDLPEVDHIDRDKINNSLDNLRWVNRTENNSNRTVKKYGKRDSLDNLRWVNRTENNSNRTVKKYGKREFLDHAPNDITEIRTFNDVDYPENRYFFCFENDRVVQRVNDHKWQWLAQAPHRGYLRINMRDINGRYHQVYVHKLIRHFRNEPATDAENVDE